MKNWNKPQIVSMNSDAIISQVKTAARSWGDWCLNGDFR